ncbi:ankyrin repeat-containing protein [Anaeramoeba ignava]|uniref:Ankyrin repeat-containing protein n=1 Tax=Anaeramoeba ignava TaxID=1746090 RepID=A0A9Q0LXY1_ANAIG|nr:ankyrin repeat-containing protein [Anaeramoeba ignava]
MSFSQNSFQEILQAIQKNDTKKLEILLKKDLEIPLLKLFVLAIRLGNKEIVQIFINKEFDLNSHDNKTPLHFALDNKNAKEDIIKLLIDSGANVNAQTLITPLHLACRNSVSISIIKLLLSSNAQINQITKKTPLHFVCLANNISNPIIELLLNSGADPNIQDVIIYIILNQQKKQNKTIIHKIYFELIGSILSIIYLLFYLVLICFESKPSLDILKLFLKFGANLNLKDGNTPLHISCEKNADPQCILFLINSGANINEKTSRTPLHLACENDVNPEIVKVLIENGAEVNCEDKKNPLHLACRKEASTSIIALLLDNGANLENKDVPFDLANEKTKKFMICYNSYAQDMKRLSKLDQTCDLYIKNNGKTIGFHKCILNARLKKKKSIEEIERYFEKMKDSDLLLLKRYIYTGFVEDQEEFERVEDHFKKMGIEEKIKKNNKDQLVKDISQLYYDQESKDFTILIESSEIKVHKAILIARSEIYKGMFLSVNDDSNSVHDYSGKGIESFNTFIKFLYFDSIDSDQSEILMDLEELYDYYQLNENSLLRFELDF